MDYSAALKKPSQKKEEKKSVLPIKRKRTMNSVSENSNKDESDSTEMEVGTNSETNEPQTSAPIFPASKKLKFDHIEERQINIPKNRLAPLKTHWNSIYEPIANNLLLNIKFCLKTRQVKLRSTEKTPNASNIQKGADFLRAFVCGFDVADALALIRLHDLYVETFDIKDVKLSLQGDSMGRAVGRLAGKGGKTRFILENATKTRIIIADTKVHILGSFNDIAQARRCISSIIMGSPAAKVFGNLKAYSSASA